MGADAGHRHALFRTGARRRLGGQRGGSGGFTLAVVDQVFLGHCGRRGRCRRPWTGRCALPRRRGGRPGDSSLGALAGGLRRLGLAGAGAAALASSFAGAGAAAAAPSSMIAMICSLFTVAAFLMADFLQYAVDRGGHFEHDLVGLQIDQVLVALDRITDLLVPGGGWWASETDSRTGTLTSMDIQGPWLR